MRKRFPALLLILFVLCVLGGLWYLLQDDIPAPTSESAETGTQHSHNPPPIKDTQPTPDKAPPQEKTQPPPEQTSNDSAPEEPVSTDDDGPEPFVVEGVISDEATDEPVSGASVTIYGPGDKRATKSDSEGAFRVEYPPGTDKPEDIDIVTNHLKYEEHDETFFELDEPIRISLRAVAVVNVRIEGTGTLPSKAWIHWEDGVAGDKPRGGFDPETRTATIRIADIPENTRGCARVDWFGRLIESGPIAFELGVVREVVLRPPAGAAVAVRVMGPDSRPMAGVKVMALAGAGSWMYARTDEVGQADFVGVPVPASLELELVSSREGLFCVGPRTVELNNAGDRREVLFDLTHTSVVDCRLTAYSTLLDHLEIESLDDGEFYSVWFGDPYPAHRIYGLRKGRYRVTASRFTPGMKFEDELEVLPPPQVTEWHKDYRGFTVRVQAVGAPRDAELYLVEISSTFHPEHDPQEHNEWVLETDTNGPVQVMIRGSGYASRVVEVRPELQNPVKLEVVRCGTLKLTASSPRIRSAHIEGIEPNQPEWFVSVPDTLALLPGRYRVADPYGFAVPWDPVEVTVRAGETTECQVGPSTVCTLNVNFSDPMILRRGEVRLFQGGTEIPFTSSGDLDGRYVIVYSAEGKVTFHFEREGYEPITKEIEIKHNGNATIQVKMKPLD